MEAKQIGGGGGGGYTASYSQLHNAAKKESDPVPEIRDVRLYFATQLAQCGASLPGRIPALVGQCPPETQSTLGNYCRAANVHVQ